MQLATSCVLAPLSSPLLRMVVRPRLPVPPRPLRSILSPAVDALNVLRVNAARTWVCAWGHTWSSEWLVCVCTMYVGRIAASRVYD